MNNPLLVIKKLNELANEAVTATTEIEKAAIFGAVRTLINDLESGDTGNLRENIERTRWSICAILGYDVTNGHTKEQHLSWARTALAAIERAFSPV